MSFSLSKTDYILYRECPKNTWFKIHKPDLYYASGLSDFEKAIIETGNEVELVARKLFPEGKLIEGRGIEAQHLTQDYLAKHEPVLFQSAFSQDGFFAAVDILKFDPVTSSHAIFEIKATSDIDEKVHLFDLAFQVVLLRKMGLEINEIGLIHLDPEYKRFGALNIQNLFKVEDVTAAVEELIQGVSTSPLSSVEGSHERTTDDGVDDSTLNPVGIEGAIVSPTSALLKLFLLLILKTIKTPSAIMATMRKNNLTISYCGFRKNDILCLS
jgi:hypothetical protein